MSKIVIDARRIRESTGRYTRGLLEELQKIDKENQYHVIIHTKDQGAWVPSAKNFYLHVVKYDHYTFGEQLGFAVFLKKLKPDLIHFTMPQQPLLYFGKRVTTVHDLTLVRFKNIDGSRVVYNLQQSVFKFLIKNVSKRSKVLITPSKFVKDDLSNYAHINPKKITVTYEAEAPLKKLESVPVTPLVGKDFIFYVGNAFPHKNLHRLVESFELLQVKHPKLHLAMAGKTEFFYKQLERQSKGIANLHFLGFIPDEQLEWLYKHASAYVFPSLSEGFGLPGIDVMQHRLPLISSNTTCLPEVYGEAACYFDPLSIDDISNTINKVLGSQKLRSELIKHGDKQALKYSWNKLAKQTQKAYFKALA